MLFAGFNVSNGDQTLIGITLAGLAGNMVGSWLTYAIGYYGRLDLLEKNRLIHLSPSRLAWVDGWFKRHGDATVFFARLLPLVRAFISLPAGVAKMPFWRFTWLTALGSLPWVLGFGLLGRGGRRQLGAVAPPPPGARLPGGRRRSSGWSSTR